MAEQRSQEMLAIGHSLDRIERIAQPGRALTLGQARMVAVECESVRCAAGTLESRSRAAARELERYHADLAAERVRLGGLTMGELERIAAHEGVSIATRHRKEDAVERIARRRLERK